jgi:hypothetical protein
VRGYDAVGRSPAEHVQVAVLEAFRASSECRKRRRLISLERGDSALKHGLRLLGRAGLASRRAFVRGDE